MKRALIAVFCILLFVPSVLAGEFWASKKSNKYHYPDCKWAQKIKPENLVKFKTPEDAIEAGYVPCKVCRPPISSKSESSINENLNLAQLEGCCSWHDGICGCNWDGRVICCDGTLSPTCYCW